MSLKIFTYFVVVFAFLFAVSVGGQAQDDAVFKGQLRAANENTLLSERGVVRLWGVERVEGLSAVLRAKGRGALDDAVSGAEVLCRVKARMEDGGFAGQCMGAAEQDLALLMLQQGYLSADRGKIYGSVFEEAYIQAEREAQVQGRGIWAASGAGSDGLGRYETLILVLGFVLFLFVVVTFIIMNIIIRGFEKVSAAQERHSDMIGRERTLKDKERSIVVTMLDSEIKANKSKIEAYLIVYEEMISALKDPERKPKYKRTGDVVQKQPALDRSVFDGNTDKLDALGDRLSSAVVHFYARIKTKPDYVNLEPDVPLDEAVAMVDAGIENARRLNELAEGLIESLHAFHEGRG